jgi:hypothetical protein
MKLFKVINKETWTLRLRIPSLFSFVKPASIFSEKMTIIPEELQMEMSSDQYGVSKYQQPKLVF